MTMKLMVPCIEILSATLPLRAQSVIVVAVAAQVQAAGLGVAPPGGFVSGSQLRGGHAPQADERAELGRGLQARVEGVGALGDLGPGLQRRRR